MKQNVAKLKSHSGRRLKQLLLAFGVIFMVAVLSPVDVLAGSERGTKKCSDGIDNDGDGKTDAADPDCADFTGGGDDTVDLSNLVRVQMEDWGLAGGISRDNVDTCPLDPAIYDYWAGTDSGENGLIGDDPAAGCAFHNIRSDASGGGRWKLILPTSEPGDLATERWLTVDFSDSDSADACPDFEHEGEDGYFDVAVYGTDEGVSSADGECVDNLGVSLSAQRALHKSASRTPLKIRLRRLGQSDAGYWTPFAFIEYINPLYLRTPEDGDVGYATDCKRVISTEPGLGDAPVSVSPAELREWVGVFTGPLIGTYNLRFEACLTRAE